MRKLFLILTCMVAAIAMAVPAKKVKTTIVLADGTSKEVVLRGDEHMKFYEDAEGNVYQQTINDGFLQVDKHKLLDQWNSRIVKRNKMRTNRRNTRKAQWGASSNPVSGSKKGIVLLVNFSDKSLRSDHLQDYYNDFFNLEGFNLDDNNGSVHDYFMESSYGQFDLTFDVVEPITLSKSVRYYGNNGLDYIDIHVPELIVEAVRLADKQGVDFSKYDWDGDGYVDQVFVIYAGTGEEIGGPDYTIWPQEWSLEDVKEELGLGTGAVSVDGVFVNTYALSHEMGDVDETFADGIGSACHEFSHCMCLPDTYDTGYSHNEEPGYWDIMSSGVYAGEKFCGECPIAFNSYERMYCGWLTPTELTTPCQISDLKSLATNPEAYIIYNEDNHNEYYLLENRQQEGFFKYDAGHGMLIWHIDFDSDEWFNNTVNNDYSHPRLTIIPADNSSSQEYESDLEGDTWPGLTNNTTLTDISTPAASLFNNNSDGYKFMNKPITDIAENEGLISFSFNEVGIYPVPVAKVASRITDDSFVANWQETIRKPEYEVELTSISKDGSKTAQTITTAETSYTFSDLTTDNTYSYRVRTVNEKGSSDWSDAIDVDLTSSAICSLGEFGYMSIQDAVDEVCKGDTVNILNDVRLTSSILVGKTTPAFSVDLNGHVLDASLIPTPENGGDAACIFYNFGNLHIIDSYPETTHTDSLENIKGGVLTGGKGVFYEYEEGNFATYACGGAIYNAGTITIDGVTFFRNSALYGGAIISRIATLTLENTRFVENTSDQGGAIASKSSNIRMKNCTAEGCSATFGGALGLDGDTLSMNNCIFTDNTAKYGGALYGTRGGQYNIAGCTFDNNNAEVSGGGIGMYNQGYYTLTDCVISNNNAKYGGGIENYKAYATIIGCTISNNTSDYGGGLDLEYGTTEMENCQILNNSSFACGGLQILTDTQASFVNCEISGNSCKEQGGAIGNFGTLTVENCTITGNTSGSQYYSAGLYVWDAATTLKGKNIIKDNYTNGNSANLCLSGKKKTSQVVLDEIAEDTEIGVTTELNDVEGAYRFTTNGTADDVKFFTADNPAYYVSYNSNGYLELLIAPTFISPVNTSANDIFDMYDLNGRKISPSNMQKGIYIINNKKIIRK